MTFRERGKDKFCTDLPTCNLIVKKNILDILGYFNESYITGEDKEFCNRLMRNNIKIFFSQKVIIYHHRRSLFLPFITQRLVYGLSILKIIKDNLTIPNLCLFLPAFFIFLISFLFIFSIFNHHVFFIILLISLLYLLLIAFESLRWASNLFDIPYTFLAIIIGNFVPGIGTFLALVNTGTIIRKKYRNY
jgi:cellulose synthase/poly-beta-1,6-N-acetylglucosamine synthase-like glycosyltransferase